jgi:hypothetical protein
MVDDMMPLWVRVVELPDTAMWPMSPPAEAAAELALTLAGCAPIIRDDGRRSNPMEIYCVKCKAKTETRELVGITMKNGRDAAQGICVDCGTKKFRIGALPPGA